MKKQTFRKISIVGLVLMGASAVAAAMVPSKSKETTNAKQVQGNLTASSLAGGNGTLTCSEGEENDEDVFCDYTATNAISDSLTTTALGAGAQDSLSTTTIGGLPVEDQQTFENTTIVEL